MTNPTLKMMNWLLRPILCVVVLPLCACPGSLSSDGAVMADLAATSPDLGGQQPDLTTQPSGDMAISASSDLATTPGDAAMVNADLANVMVNGCDPATATDDTAQSTITITFPGGNFKYTPACIKVKKGAMVTFSGGFQSHPLSGGSNPPTVDATSPITHTATGTTATFTMANTGSFGYYCDFHWSSGMMGAIFVVP